MNDRSRSSIEYKYIHNGLLPVMCAKRKSSDIHSDCKACKDCVPPKPKRYAFWTYDVANPFVRFTGLLMNTRRNAERNWEATEGGKAIRRFAKRRSKQRSALRTKGAATRIPFEIFQSFQYDNNGRPDLWTHIHTAVWFIGSLSTWQRSR